MSIWHSVLITDIQEKFVGMINGEKIENTLASCGRCGLFSLKHSSHNLESYQDWGELELTFSDSIPIHDGWVTFYPEKNPVKKKLYDGQILVENPLKDFSSVDMTNWVELSNGQFLYNDYGKYKPNLTFLGLSVPYFPEYSVVSPSQFNLPKGNMSFLKGEYFRSKKGTPCFRLSETGPHILIRDDWGGAFNKYGGGMLEKLPNRLYYRRASSNGGGNGYDYIIVPEGTKYIMSEEDI